jgi:hypothetical protein
MAEDVSADQLQPGDAVAQRLPSNRHLLPEHLDQESRMKTHPSTWGASLTRWSSVSAVKW